MAGGRDPWRGADGPRQAPRYGGRPPRPPANGRRQVDRADRTSWSGHNGHDGQSAYGQDQPPPPYRERPRERPRPEPLPEFDRRSIFIGPADQDPRGQQPGARVASPPPRPPRPPRRDDWGEEPLPRLDRASHGMRRTRRSWVQRLLLTGGVLISVLCLFGVAVAAWALNTYNSIDRFDVKVREVEAGDPQNFLIVGSDSRSGDNGEYGSVGGQRSDSIMIMRVDPKSKQAYVLSFPRDLQVHIAGSSPGSIAKINSAYAGTSANPQRLIDTLEENFGVPIHHYVEIDFEGFKHLIDYVGGVDLWFNAAVKNPPGEHDVGLNITTLGCVNVKGDQALALARSRSLLYRAPDGWHQDPFGDYGRMTRQQIIIRQALKKAARKAKSNVLNLKDAAELMAKTVGLDKQIGISDLLDLVDRFKNFDPNQLVTLSLPTKTKDAQGMGNPYPDMVQAEPVLNSFRGLPINEVGPSLVDLKVTNGSGKEGQAVNVAGAFQKVGFKVEQPDTTTPIAHTTVYYAPGQQAYGLRVARHITGTVAMAAKADLAPGQVQLVTGADFTTIHQDPTPIDQMPKATPPAGSTATTTATTAAPKPKSTTATTAQPPPQTPQRGYAAGQPPPGVRCGE